MVAFVPSHSMPLHVWAPTVGPSGISAPLTRERPMLNLADVCSSPVRSATLIDNVRDWPESENRITTDARSVLAAVLVARVVVDLPDDELEG